MPEKVEIRLTAVDGTVKVFKASGDAATSMASKVEDAGKRSARSLKGAEEAGRKLGAGLAALGLGSVKLAADQERLAYALERNYGDAAQSFQDFADKIQNTTIFSDDMVIQGANVAAQLQRNFQFTDEMIQQVITSAADLASLYGTDLASAVDRVVAGLRGEAESAEMIGLSLGDSSTGIDKMSASLSEAEKAQIRFIALTEQATYAQGSAVAVAGQSGQSWRAWKNQAQDALQGVGASLSDYQSEIIALGAASQVLGPVGSGLKTLAQTQKAAQIGSAALGLAMGPAGLVAGAAAAAAGIYYLVTKTDDYVSAADSAASTTASLADTYAALAASLDNVGEKQALANLLNDLDETQATGQRNVEVLNALNNQIKTMEIGGEWSTDLVQGLTEVDSAWLDSVFGDGSGVLQMEELRRAQEYYAASMLLTSQQITDVTDDISAGLGHAGVDAKKMTADFDAALDRFKAGEIDGPAFVAEIDRIATGWAGYTDEVLSAAVETRNAQAAVALMTGTLDSQVVVLDANTTALTENSIAIAQNKQERRGGEQDAYWENEAHDIYLASEAYDEWRHKNETRGKEQDQYLANQELVSLAMRGEIDLLGMTGQALQDLSLAQGGSINVRQIAIATSERAADAAVEETARLEQLASAYEAITGRDVDLTGLAGPQTVELNVALNTDDAVRSLENTFRVAVQNTNQTSGLVDNVLKWGEELIGVEGTYAEIDDLVASGAISAERHGMAQRAYNRMVEDGAGIQEDILAIQAKQAPYIANDVRNLERQYTLIADMAPAAARVALGFMDGSQSAAAMAFHTQMMADAQGGLLDDNAAFWNATIDGLETANPGLLAMLETTGQVKKTLDEAGNWDGVSYEVNLEGAEEATSVLEGITTALDNLVKYEEMRIDVDLNDDGIIGYEPPEKEMKVKPVVEEGADAPTFDPITWPVDLKINENAPPTFDPITVAVEPEWPQYTIQPATPPAIKVAYEYETFDPPELTNYTATIDVEVAAANEAIGDTERLLGTIDTTTATAIVDLDTGPFDTAYSTVTADVAALDALTATVSVAITSTVAGKVQDITNDVETIDALSASVSVSMVSAVAGKVQDITNDVETIDALAATVDFNAIRELYNTVRNEVSSDVNLAMGWSATVDFNANRDGYNAVRNEVSSDVNLAEAWNPIVDFGGDASGFYGVRDGVSSSVGVIDGWSATVDIGADASGYYANLPPTGQTIGTNYINVEQRPIGGGAPRPFATGGVVIRAAEAGPEMVTSPSGMRAILPRDGLYNVREGSYVSPAAATRGQTGGGGGGDRPIVINGNVFVTAATPDIHDALNGQLLAQGRR